MEVWERSVKTEGGQALLLGWEAAARTPGWFRARQGGQAEVGPAEGKEA